MKCLVVYFSLSGNTKRIAQAICRGMGQSVEQCDLKPLRDVRSEDLKGYDLIGLGSLVLNAREPGVVSNFIQETLRDVDGKHAFVFSTHGALPGYFLAMAVPAMIQRGLTVIGWKDWFCDVTFPVTPSPYFISGHPDEVDLEEAEEFGKEMVGRSRRVLQGETALIPALPRGKAYDELYVPVELPPTRRFPEEWMKLLKAQDGVRFTVNPEKCKSPKCHVCVDNCPTGGIDFSVSPPIFDCRGAKCFHCEQICPHGAIEADYTVFKEAHDVFTVELIQRSLEFFEAKGRFRRLTPLEDIGWDNPFWKSRKRPRYKRA
jgi:flavodoxin/ferredoxin